MMAFAVRRRPWRCQMRYLGVIMLCGTPPGTNSVLLPLPLFMRKPCPPLPASVVVSIEPTWPVTNTCPLDVMTECPTDDTKCSIDDVGEEENGSASCAHAWAHDPASKAMARIAVGPRTMRQSSARVVLMSVSFPAFEPGPPDDGRFICSGRRIRWRSHRVAGMTNRVAPFDLRLRQCAWRHVRAEFVGMVRR
jgi:hypothetical protein